MKQFYLIVVLLFGIVMSTLAQESVTLKTNKFEIGYMSTDGFKTTAPTKALFLTFVVTDEVIYVNDVARSRYNLIDKISEKDIPGESFAVEYRATDEDDVPCKIRLYVSDNFSSVWIMYSNSRIIRYMNY